MRMRTRYVDLLVGAILLATGFVSEADAGRSKLTPTAIQPVGEQQFLHDPPVAHLNALKRSARGADTTFYGGFDGSIAVASSDPSVAIWDFEDGTLQGWTSVDITSIPVRVRRVTASSFSGSAGSASGLITHGGSTGSMWFGAFQEEAEAGCWPGGMGYSNGWGMTASKSVNYSGAGNVNLRFDYFTDSETQFDFSYVYIVNQDGERRGPFNTSQWSNPDTGFGFSGSGVEGTNLGTPTNPVVQHEIIIDNSNFAGSGLYDLQFNFDSDPLLSDGLDSFTAGFLDSEFGPFGVDDVRVDGTIQGDFESGADGWDFRVDGQIGKLLKVVALDDLDPIADACVCPLTTGDNTYVLVCADITPGSVPHPQKQHEVASSPSAAIINDDNKLGMLWTAWADNPFDAGVGYRRGIYYFPWTCPETGTVGWTLDLAAPSGYTFTDPARCARYTQDFSTFFPAGTDSVKLVIDFLSDCNDFDIDDCLPVDQQNQTPYLDDIQIWTVGAVQAPALARDITFADVFPSENTLYPNKTVGVHSWYDNNRADSDDTNANMGDSAVVLAGTQANTRVFLNFRVYPGPYTNTANPFFSRYGGNFIAPGGGWAKARMDTAETDSGVQAGLYATYLHESDGGSEGSSTYKLIADGVLTPGSTIEYFFTGDFGVGQPEDVSPDTTGGFFLEFEALPGYFAAPETGDWEVLGPCLLYVDAFNNGAQVPIEEFGLTPYLGSDLNDGDNWDRYDYMAAGTTTSAPLARESSGDNGMTKFQSLFYRAILYNTGTNSMEGLRNGDAELLINWLSTDDLGRDSIRKGLWLSGNGMANILEHGARPASNTLLTNFAGAQLACPTYRDAGCGTPGGDESFCVRLDQSVGANFGSPTYSAVSRNGCPNLASFNVISAVIPGNGDIEYVDQDAPGQSARQFASVSNDQFSSPLTYGVVLDAFSLHFLRRVESGFDGSTREECGEDSSAISIRVENVLGWFGVSAGGCAPPISLSTPPSSSPVAKTMLLQNAPNPFNPRTSVRYQIAEEAHVTVQVFDVTGKLVRTLVNEVQAPEAYSVVWDGSTEAGAPVSSGVFWAKMTTSRGFRASTKMVVLK